MSPLLLPRNLSYVFPQMNPTSAGDSAPYERRASSLDDVVIVSALRTPICKAKRGGFKDTPADDLLAAVLKATLQQTGVEPQVASAPMRLVARVSCSM